MGEVKAASALRKGKDTGYRSKDGYDEARARVRRVWLTKRRPTRRCTRGRRNGTGVRGNSDMMRRERFSFEHDGVNVIRVGFVVREWDELELLVPLHMRVSMVDRETIKHAYNSSCDI
jgi:hypothetical protein